MTSFVKVAFAGAALTLAGASAQAQECPSEPLFAAATAPNSDVRASVSRLGRGDWATAAHFAGEALDSGTSRRNKAAAAANLCFALAKLGDAGAGAACDDAVARAGSSRWEAYNNRGAAYWLSGDLQSAAEDFMRAAELEGDGDAMDNARGLAACVS